MKALLVRELKELAGFWVVALIVTGALLASSQEPDKALVPVLIVPTGSAQFGVLLGSVFAGALLGFVSWGREHWLGTREYLLHRGLNAHYIVLVKFSAGAVTLLLLWPVPVTIWAIWIQISSAYGELIQFERVFECVLIATSSWPAYALGAIAASFLGSKRPWMSAALVMALIGQCFFYLVLREAPMESLALRRTLFLLINGAACWWLLRVASAELIRSSDAERKIGGGLGWSFACGLLLCTGFGWVGVSWLTEAQVRSAVTTYYPSLVTDQAGFIRAHSRIHNNTSNPTTSAGRVSRGSIGQLPIELIQLLPELDRHHESVRDLWRAPAAMGIVGEHRFLKDPSNSRAFVSRRLSSQEGKLGMTLDGYWMVEVSVFLDLDASHVKLIAWPNLGWEMESEDGELPSFELPRIWTIEHPKDRFSDDLLFHSWLGDLLVYDRGRSEQWIFNVDTEELRESRLPLDVTFDFIFSMHAHLIPEAIDQSGHHWLWGDGDAWSSIGEINSSTESKQHQRQLETFDRALNIDVSGWWRMMPHVAILSKDGGELIASHAFSPKSIEAKALGALDLVLVASMPPICMLASLDTNSEGDTGGAHPFDNGSFDVANPWPLCLLNLLAALTLALFAVRRMDATKQRKRFWIAACLVCGPAGYVCARVFEPRSA